MRNILKHKIIITVTCILTSMIVIPASLYAIENQETLEHEIGVYYTIQKGDTLWDISKKYFDSPWVWPELWKENKYIKNPHFIEPGDMLRLFYNRESDLILNEDQSPEDSNSQSENTCEKDILYFNYPAIDSIGFIKKEPVSPNGSIFKVKDDKVVISEGDLVYVKNENNSDFVPGSKYTVYRTFEPLADSTPGSAGKQHYLTGIVEIKTVEPLYVIAEVLKSFREIAINDLLMPYEPRSPKIPIIESNKEIECSILVPEETKELIGDNTIVFIDKGEKDGIKPGQFYHIYYREKENISPDSLVSTYLAPVDFGKLFVLISEQTTASAVITRSDREIFTGAAVRYPVE
ncbi:MAG: LysM domain-containing protein [Pseudomonadota bacterium]